MLTECDNSKLNTDESMDYVYLEYFDRDSEGHFGDEDSSAKDDGGIIYLENGYYKKLNGAKKGLYKVVTTSKGEKREPIRVGDCIEVLGQTRNINSEEWGLYVGWFDPDEKTHALILTYEMLNTNNSDWFGQLTHGGWSGNKREILEFFMVQKPTKRFLSTQRCGWHGKIYITPHEALSRDDETAIFTKKIKENLYTTSGSYEEWKKLAELSDGNSRLVFSICCGFAGILLELSGLESGGFNLEGGSSCGKSTALQLCASICGSREHVRQWRTTDNGLESIAMLHNDNTLILDEMGQVSAKVLSESVYMLSNDMGKIRAGKNALSRDVSRWKLICSSLDLIVHFPVF